MTKVAMAVKPPYDLSRFAAEYTIGDVVDKAYKNQYRTEMGTKYQLGMDKCNRKAVGI